MLGTPQADSLWCGIFWHQAAPGPHLLISNSSPPQHGERPHKHPNFPAGGSTALSENQHPRRVDPRIPSDPRIPPAGWWLQRLSPVPPLLAGSSVVSAAGAPLALCLIALGSAQKRIFGERFPIMLPSQTPPCFFPGCAPTRQRSSAPSCVALCLSPRRETPGGQGCSLSCPHLVPSGPGTMIGR